TVADPQLNICSVSSGSESEADLVADCGHVDFATTVFADCSCTEIVDFLGAGVSAVAYPQLIVLGMVGGVCVIGYEVDSAADVSWAVDNRQSANPCIAEILEKRVARGRTQVQLAAGGEEDVVNRHQQAIFQGFESESDNRATGAADSLATVAPTVRLPS